ncbi:MAG: hypothetical protein WCJ03_01435 [Bacteroidales bacterium]
MEISVVLSNELIDKEWIEITDGFNQCFDTQKQPADMKNYYSSSILGYCFHAICRNLSNEIIAHSSIFPYKYCVIDKEYLFGLSGGSYVLKEFRKEAFLYVDLIEALKERSLKEGVVVTYGVPNENSFELTTDFLGSTFLKYLHFYLLPISFSSLNPRIKIAFLDKVSSILATCWIGINAINSTIVDSIEPVKPVQLLRTEEVKNLRFGDKYKNVKQSEYRGVYRIVEEQGVKTAYVMDFRKNERRSYRALVFLVRYILNTEKVDAILFVGQLSFFQMLLIKVPQRFVPQRLPITYDILDKSSNEFVRMVSNPDNWDFSLMNFDAR